MGPTIATSRVLPAWSGGPARKIRRRAFTLVELLVVISIIALLGGLFIPALSHKGGQGGLATAQGALSGLLNYARTEASLTQGPARLLIYDTAPTPDETRYLTRVQVVVPDPNKAGNWVTKGDIVDLPGGIYVVPPGPPTGSAVPVPLNSQTPWPTNLASTGLAAQPLNVDGATTSTTYFYLEFTPLGTINSATIATSGLTLVLANGTPHLPGDTTDTQPVRFITPNDVRGLLISQYGVQTFLNDYNDFQ